MAAYSDFSQASRSAPPSSARPSSNSHKVAGESLAGAVRRASLQAVPEEEANVCRWSEVAKFSRKLEEIEKVKQREATRNAQQQMRDYLQRQIEEKKSQKQRESEEERALFEHQEAELERWRTHQTAQQEEQRKRVMEVKKQREEQCATINHRREEERRLKLEEDQRLVQKAATDLERERKAIEDRKIESKLAQARLAKECLEGKASRADERTKRIEEERKKVEEYRDMLERQEARNKQVIPKVRSTLDTAPQPRRRRGEEIYYDEDLVMRQLLENKRRAEEAEREKIEKMKAERQSNQEFLFQQMAERDRKRHLDSEQKGSQKLAVQAAITDYLETERLKIEEKRNRNIQYRLELEKQIQDKKPIAARQQKLNEDEMSAAERAINRNIISQAVQLRHQQP